MIRSGSRPGPGACAPPRWGFTLVELLVVVAIIALLMGVLMPALSRARASGDTVTCLNNMRQLVVCTHSYAEDHRRQMPRSQHSAFPNRVAPWGYAFFEYVTGDRYRTDDERWRSVMNNVYHCPADRRRGRWSYGYNVYFELTREETAGRTWTRLELAPSPSRTVLFGELADQSTADHVMAHFWTQFNAPPEVAMTRHRSNCAHAYLDGHASCHPFAQSFSPRLAIDLWNPATAR